MIFIAKVSELASASVVHVKASEKMDSRFLGKSIFVPATMPRPLDERSFFELKKKDSSKKANWLPF